MKKKLLTLGASTLMMMALMVGCGSVEDNPGDFKEKTTENSKIENITEIETEIIIEQKTYNQEDKLSVEDVKKIALEHAEHEEANVKFTEMLENTEDGIEVYQMKFETTHKPYIYWYEYKIDAFTGEILDSHIDSLNRVFLYDSSLDK